LCLSAPSASPAMQLFGGLRALCALVPLALSHAATLRGAPPAGANTSVAAPAHRARLDVGFGTFEKDAANEVARSINANLRSADWNDALRARLIANVSALLHDTLATELKPLKQSIGKTWMALPEEHQKDDYVEQLRSSFASMFETTVERVGGHANVSLGRVATTTTAKKVTQEELVKSALQSLNGSLFADHCYDEPAKKLANKTVAQKNVTALSQSDATPPGQFCVKSLLHSFVHRLDDSVNLVSMTMRFDARAMAMMQQGKREKKAEAARGKGGK